MKMMRLAFAAVLWFAVAANAAELPYNEAADAKADIQAGLAEARASHSAVLLIFGANWCEDCRALNAALKAEKSADLLTRAFKVVKIDVGRFDRNLDIAAAYGDPIRKGIPAAVVLSPDDKIIYATRAGELADARRMSHEGIYEFFAEKAKQAKTAN